MTHNPDDGGCRGGKPSAPTGRILIPVRCGHCDARLFDTDGQETTRPASVEVRIKCWRCGRVAVVRLAGEGWREGERAIMKALEADLDAPSSQQ